MVSSQEGRLRDSVVFVIVPIDNLQGHRLIKQCGGMGQGEQWDDGRRLMPRLGGPWGAGLPKCSSGTFGSGYSRGLMMLEPDMP